MIKMVKNIFNYTLILLLFSSFFSCDLYPDWKDKVEYSDTYPISGEWYVADYDENGNKKEENPANAYSVIISAQQISTASARPASIRAAPWARAMVEEAQVALMVVPLPVKPSFRPTMSHREESKTS